MPELENKTNLTVEKVVTSNELSEAIFTTIPTVMKTIRYQMRASVEGLTIPQFRILARLNDGPTTHCDLADWIGVSLPAISRMVNLLEGRNLVRRDRQEKDRRYVNLILTPQGCTFFKKCRGEGQKSLSKRFYSMPSKDKKVIFDALKLLGSALEQTEDSK